MDIIMPKMGESVSEGTIIKWHKKEGDPVKRDEIIFEISTDKVDTEIPAPSDGVLKEIKVNEGETVLVGTVVAVMDTNGAASVSTAPDETKKKDAEKVKVIEEKAETEPVKEASAQAAPVVTLERKSTGSTSGNLIDIAMPKMGESVMEGTIIKWHKKVGEPVKKDETIFEISTDKVDTEVPSPAAGTLAEILVAEQETVEVGTIVARLATGEYIPSEAGKDESKSRVNEGKSGPEEKQETVQTFAKEESAAMHDNFSNVSVPDVQQDTGEGSGSKFYSPLVLNIAQKENVSLNELEKIKGTGLEGRVSKKDILSYIENRGKQKSEPVKEVKKEQTAPAFQSSQFQPSYSSSDVEKIPMDNIRQKIMQHMVTSRDTSVHVSAMLEVDMGKIYNFIRAKKEEFIKSKGIKLTYMPFIADAVVKALKQYPLVNSAIEGSTIIKKKFINLGIAVAIEPAGLIVPNIKNADEKNILGLAKSIADIAERSRTKKLSPDDISNGTFTITNYGVFGTIFGTPIINQPEVAILGVGTIVKRPVVIELEGMDTIAIKPIMSLTLSHDHRLVDGMLGGKFLKFIKDTLEGFDQGTI